MSNLIIVPDIKPTYVAPICLTGLKPGTSSSTLRGRYSIIPTRVPEREEQSIIISVPQQFYQHVAYASMDHDRTQFKDL
ncbi:unnamed protein product [Fusarium graminearum]|uniref:Chromosome 2, complete genome n=2 Tax=Gibberella zeae TaxID=5518 RepID=A0A098DB80_GIBZE|nr:unnamed protein product [Fusarium graminearum]CAG1962604.1 unnamed protein product [Fusarium graminearum]CAG2010881.1 unnamed protein product [Fusarium graminearum]CEF76209.1 unnamed protein product [Fusarium graminearum]VTO81720.1 unnamed protein product [Fusarium graminearum]